MHNRTISVRSSLKNYIMSAGKILLIASCVVLVNRAASVYAETTNDIRLIELQGKVEMSPAGATAWVLTQTNQILHAFDRLRTGPNSRAALRWSDQSVVPLNALTEIEILPPQDNSE